MQTKNSVALPTAVWLAANNGYDLVPEPNLISATKLLSPIRSLVLSARATEEELADVDNDLTRNLSSKIGTAVHSAIEEAWKSDLTAVMEALGYPHSVASRVRLNPTELQEGDLPVYVEQRTNKQVGNWVISGKFDFVVDGELHDIKTSKAYSWMQGTAKKDYAIQGSIYRWLNPTLITSDYVRINWIITDWSANQASSNSLYPQKAVFFQDLALMSIADTQAYIEERLKMLDSYRDAPQDALPKCTPAELWQDTPKWAYYANRAVTTRATRVFDTEPEAINKLAADGFKGIVLKREGEARKCNYCAVRPICQQAEELSNKGALK